jgi:DNA-binding HxlR family transcriptional regulator
MIVVTRSLQNPHAMRAIRVLSRGPTRVNVLERELELRNPAALSYVLKKLQRDGAVEPVVITLGPPPAVQYRLTKLGAELAARVNPLLDLLDEREPMIERARAKSRVEMETRRANDLREAATT